MHEETRAKKLHGHQYKTTYTPMHVHTHTHTESFMIDYTYLNQEVITLNFKDSCGDQTPGSTNMVEPLSVRFVHI